jgi:hypothetical protein
MIDNEAAKLPARTGDKDTGLMLTHMSSSY